MTLLRWDPTWATGIARIDHQHLELLERINRLSDALIHGGLGGEIERTLLHLGEYVGTHFRDEEALMAEVGYPDLPRHRSIHDDLRTTVEALPEIYLEDPAALPADLMKFLSSWLVEHLSGEDRLMAEYVRNRGRAPHP